MTIYHPAEELPNVVRKGHTFGHRDDWGFCPICNPDKEEPVADKLKKEYDEKTAQEARDREVQAIIDQGKEDLEENGWAEIDLGALLNAAGA